MSDKVLSYHDVLLRQGDVDLLRGQYWLNDQVIAFYFEYLEREKHGKGTKALRFVPASIAFLLTHTPANQLKTMGEMLGLMNHNVLLCALNDNPDVCQAAGGSHWSLGVLFTDTAELVHIDSYAGSNHSCAVAFATACSHMSGRTCSIVEPPCLQQGNSYDCGIFVCAFADAVAKWCLHNGCSTAAQLTQLLQQQLRSNVAEDGAAMLRKDMLQLVLSKAAS